MRYSAQCVSEMQETVVVPRRPGWEEDSFFTGSALHLFEYITQCLHVLGFLWKKELKQHSNGFLLTFVEFKISTKEDNHVSQIALFLMSAGSPVWHISPTPDSSLSQENVFIPLYWPHTDIVSSMWCQHYIYEQFFLQLDSGFLRKTWETYESHKPHT